MTAATTSTLQGAKALVLNRSYLPIHVTSARRAFSLMYRGVAKAVDEEYRTFAFEEWHGLGCNGHAAIGLVGSRVRVPRVILLTGFDRLPRREVRFSRNNIFVRDGSTCQYCGLRRHPSQLNLDHVVPRTQGGLTTWENVVCACIECNRRKGGRRPEQARMRLRKRPARPSWTPFVARSLVSPPYSEWRPFLGGIDLWETDSEIHRV